MKEKVVEKRIHYHCTQPANKHKTRAQRLHMHSHPFICCKCGTIASMWKTGGCWEKNIALESVSHCSVWKSGKNKRIECIWLKSDVKLVDLLILMSCRCNTVTVLTQNITKGKHFFFSLWPKDVRKNKQVKD